MGNVSTLLNTNHAILPRFRSIEAHFSRSCLPQIALFPASSPAFWIIQTFIKINIKKSFYNILVSYEINYYLFIIYYNILYYIILLLFIIILFFYLYNNFFPPLANQPKKL